MCFYFFIEKAPSLEYRISLILRSHLNYNEGMTFLEELSQFKQLSKRDQTWGSIILVSTWYIYYKYYRSINFHERTPFMSRFSSSFDDGNVENSSSYGVIIPGFEGHTLKFFIIHGLPFFLQRYSLGIGRWSNHSSSHRGFGPRFICIAQLFTIRILCWFTLIRSSVRQRSWAVIL